MISYLQKDLDFYIKELGYDPGHATRRMIRDYPTYILGSKKELLEFLVKINEKHLNWHKDHNYKVITKLKNEIEEINKIINSGTYEYKDRSQIDIAINLKFDAEKEILNALKMFNSNPLQAMGYSESECGITNRYNYPINIKHCRDWYQGDQIHYLEQLRKIYESRNDIRNLSIESIEEQVSDEFKELIKELNYSPFRATSEIRGKYSIFMDYNLDKYLTTLKTLYRLNIDLNEKNKYINLLEMEIEWIEKELI